MTLQKRAGAWLLALCLTATLLPAVPAAAADKPGSINPDTTSAALEDLKFNTDTSKIEAFMNDKGNIPTATDETFNLFPVRELAVSGGSAGADENGNNSGSLDLNIQDYGASGDFGFGNYSTLSTGTLYHGDKTTLEGAHTSARSVAFDPTGSGKDDHIAVVTLHRAKVGNDWKVWFDLAVTDSKGDLIGERESFGGINLENDNVHEAQAGALLAITAGDYNGDGRDEIAVYNPVLAGGYSPRIELYKLSGTSLIRQSDYTKYIGYGHYEAGHDGQNRANEIFTNALAPDIAGNKEKREAGHWLNQYFSVSLATVENTGDGVDDLAVAMSVSRDANDRNEMTHQDNPRGSGAVACLTTWVNPMAAGSKTEDHYLTDNWDGAYGDKTEANRYKSEMMQFPGVDARDINGDGVPEIVVAGYRLQDPESKTSGAWDLDEERFLVTYFSYSSTLAVDKDGNPLTDGSGKPTGELDKKYVRQGPMQWVSMNGSDYDGNITMGAGLNNVGKNEGALHNPIQVEIFAERGADYVNSIFVNGYVLRALSYRGDKPASSLYTGYAEYPGDLSPSVDTTKGLYILYAYPLELVDNTKFGFVSSSSVKTIGEAVSGNFDGNVQGREQLVFTYLLRQSGAGNEGKYSAVLCSLDVKNPTQAVTNISANAWRDAVSGTGAHTDNILKGATVEVRSAFYNQEYLPLTICTPDVDDDSVLMRYDKTKAPAFYFSDPNIIAVLEAAPYFAELEPGSDPETSITTTKGEGTGSSTGANISAYLQIGYGFDISSGAGVANTTIFEMDIVGGVTGSHGWEESEAFARSVSATFSAAYEHTVALTMTPYVRYYYQQWDPKAKNGAGDWIEAYIDVPQKPQTSQLSVRRYDEVARANGWVTLGDQVLLGAEAGDPTTYLTQPPQAGEGSAVIDGSWTDTGNHLNNGGDDYTEFTGVGSGGGSTTRSFAEEYTFSSTNSWSAGATLDVETKTFGVVVNIGGEVDAFGGSTTVTSEGVEYSGTVPSLNDYELGKYDFSWKFGTYLADLTALDDKDQQDEHARRECVVLAYLVDGVIAPPRPPENLTVDSTTDRSVTLTWTERGRPPQEAQKVYTYELARVVGDNYSTLAVLDGNASGSNTFSFTDTECLPGTAYQYVVRTRIDRLMSPVGAWSAPVTAITPSQGASALIVEQPADYWAKPGVNIFNLFHVEAAPPEGAQVTVRWQTWLGGTWTDIEPDDEIFQATTHPTNTNFFRLGCKNGAVLSQGMDGRKFRCVLTVRTSSGVETLYSDPATLHIGGQSSTWFQELLVNGEGKDGQTTLGNIVRIQATVNSNSLVSGEVVFTWLNETTGAHGEVPATAEYGRFLTSFTPEEPGIYRIQAHFQENADFLPCESNTVSVAVLPEGTQQVLSLTGPDQIPYGQSAELSLMSFGGGTTGVLPGGTSGVRYTVEGNGDASVTATSTGFLFRGGQAGQTYTITVTYAGAQAVKHISVVKAEVTVAPADKTIPTNWTNTAGGWWAITDLSAENLTASGAPAGAEAEILEAVTAVSGLEIGIYSPSGTERTPKPLYGGNLEGPSTVVEPLSPDVYTLRFKEPSALENLVQDNYVLRAAEGRLTVTGSACVVTYTAGANGVVAACLTDGTQVASGGQVPAKSVVKFTAQPAPGFAVKEWSVVKGGGAGAVISGGDTLQVVVTDDTVVSVSFRLAAYPLHYGVNDDAAGWLSAYSGSASGTPIPDGGSVSMYIPVYFEAGAAEGYYIESWAVNGEILKNKDGSTFNGESYLLERPEQALDVLVSFAPVEYHTVEVSLLNAEGYPLENAGELAAVSDDAPRGDGGRIPSGSTFTVTVEADAGKGFMVQEWRSYAADGSYETLAGNVTAYTVHNLQSDLDLRVLVVTAQEYDVDFGTNPPEGGTVEAVSGGMALESGYRYQAYIPIDFKAVPEYGYRFDHWNVTPDGGADGSTDNPLHLDSLLSDLDVTASFEALTPVDIREIGGVTQPIAEETPVNTVTETEQFTGTVEWRDADGNTLGEGDAFAYETAYTAVVTLTPKEGYTFRWVPENFFAMDGASSVGNQADSGVVTAAFPPTASPTAPAITSENSATVRAGRTFQVTTNGSDPKQFTIDGAPSGVSIDAGSGLISVSSGTAVGSYSLTIRVQNTAGSDEQAFTLTVISGGGSGGGGGPSTPPAQKDTTVIDGKTGDKLIEDAVKNGGETIRIDVETNKVSLSAGFLADAGAKTSADILISTPVASIRLPNGALGGLASLGGAITVQATLEKRGSEGYLLTLDITADGKTIRQVPGGVKVTVPYADGGVNTVAILQDGGKLLPKSFAQHGQMTVPLDGPAKALLTENSKDFPDTDGHWGKEYIDFVTSHGLFQGTGSGLFEADAPMTRGMLWTVLARMEGADTASTGGVWYAKGMDWAMQSGISDGSDPLGDITREQLAVMLWRVAGSPAVSSGAPDFPDADLAGSYARDALSWAVEQGILTGKGDGSLDPLGRATRAEVSAMLMRSIIHS